MKAVGPCAVPPVRLTGSKDGAIEEATALADLA